MGFKIEDCIFFQLAKASQAGTRFWTNHVSNLNITSAQAMVLNFLGQEDGVTSRDIGSRTMLDSATLTGILDRLESAGLIQRKQHPEDRRAICICLTDSGRKITKKLYRMAIHANKAFMTDLNQEEQQTLRGLLGKIRRNV